MATVLARVRKVIVEGLMCDEEKVTPGAKLKDDLRADSLDVTEMLMALEEEFEPDIPGLEIRDGELFSGMTVSDLVHLMIRKGARETEKVGTASV